MRVEPGEFVTIVGPSGCGKSTLLKVVAGLVRPTSGVVSLMGQQVTSAAEGNRLRVPARRAARMARRAQEHPAAGRDARHGPGHAARRADELIELTGLHGLRERPAARAFRRHAAAGGAVPRAAAPAAGAAHGRAVRRARRADPRAAQRRAQPDLAGDRHHHPAGHPLHRRGGLPGYPGRGDEPTARPAHCGPSTSTCRRSATTPRSCPTPRFDRLASEIRGLLGSGANH